MTETEHCSLDLLFPFWPCVEAIKWGGVVGEHSPTGSLSSVFILAPVIKYLKVSVCSLGDTNSQFSHPSLALDAAVFLLRCHSDRWCPPTSV